MKKCGGRDVTCTLVPFAFLLFTSPWGLLALCVAEAGQGDGLARIGADAPSTPPQGFQFSARVIWRVDGKSRDALLFAKPDRYRIEHRGGIDTDLGYASVTILRLDKHETWYVLSERRMFVAVPIKPSHLLPVQATLEGEVGRTLIGDASVDGRPATLYEVVTQRYGQRETYFEWIDREREFPLKLLNQNKDWSVEYHHVVFSTQPSHYFETPRGYRRVEAQERESEREQEGK